ETIELMLKFVPVIVSGTLVSPGCSTPGLTRAMVGRASRTVKAPASTERHPFGLVAVRERVVTGAVSATEVVAPTERPSMGVTDETVTPGPKVNAVEASRLRPSMVRPCVLPCFTLAG